MEDLPKHATDAGTEEIYKFWNDVLATVRKLLETDSRFGFIRFEENVHPTIEEIIFGLGVIDSVLSLMLSSNLLDHDETRQVYNSKQCILLVRMLGEALKSKDQDEYARVMRMLETQPQF